MSVRSGGAAGAVRAFELWCELVNLRAQSTLASRRGARLEGLDGRRLEVERELAESSMAVLPMERIAARLDLQGCDRDGDATHPRQVRSARRLTAAAAAMAGWLGVSGCGRSSAGGARSGACDALAVAAEAAQALDEQAALQYASAHTAMGMWQRWEKHEVTPDEDGTGRFSGAGARAREYRSAAIALCSAADLTRWQMHALSAGSADARVRSADRATTARCAPEPKIISPDAQERDQALARVRNRRQDAKAIDGALVDACYQALGGRRREAATDRWPVVLPSE